MTMNLHTGDIIRDADFSHLFGRVVEVNGEIVRVRWQDNTCDSFVPDEQTKIVNVGNGDD